METSIGSAAMTRDEIRARYPNASESFIRRNCDYSAALPAGEPECSQGHALEPELPREKEGGDSFAIRFDIYAVRCCDWDNYSIKELQDLLVEAGFLPDDNWTALKRGEIHIHKIARREEEKTVITIKRVEK